MPWQTQYESALRLRNSLELRLAPGRRGFQLQSGRFHRGVRLRDQNGNARLAGCGNNVNQDAGRLAGQARLNPRMFYLAVTCRCFLRL